MGDLGGVPYPIWKHERTGGFYLWVNSCMVKHPVTRKWVPGVIYANKEGAVYVRTEEDFAEAFVNASLELAKDPGDG